MAQNAITSLAEKLRQLRQKSDSVSESLPPLILKAERTAQNILTGHHARKQSGLGEKFWQFREYTPSDRPQDIDWRQSAKGDRVFVRQREWQTSQAALFWCDSGKNMHYRSDTRLQEKHYNAVLLCLSLAKLMIKAEEQISALTNRKQAGRSEFALQALGTALLESKNEGLSTLNNISIPQNAQLILVSDFLDPLEDCEKIFARIAERTRNVVVIQVLDPAEIMLPFNGRVVFENVEIHEKHHISNVSSVRAAYRDRIENHLQSIHKLCAGYSWSWMLHQTNTHLEDFLHEAWTALSPHSTQSERSA